MARRPKPQPSVRKRRFVEPVDAREASIDDLVHDGLLIALSGVRIVLRNLMVVRALRDGAVYDLELYVAAVKSEFRALAQEKRADATRVTEQESRDAERADPTIPPAHRLTDSRLRARRVKVLHALADQLEADSETDAPALALIAEARAAALEDIAGSIRPATVRADEAGSDQYARSRSGRMALVAQDLAMLQLQGETY